MKLEPEWIDKLLFGIRERRFTQDSPILPEVWHRFGETPEKPQDLLLTPFAGARPGEVAAALADALIRTTTGQDQETLEKLARSRSEEKKATGKAGLEQAGQTVAAARIAYNQTTVAATLTFSQVIQCALPLTGWWKRYVDRFRPDPAAPEGEGTHSEQSGGSEDAPDPRVGYRALAHAFRRMAEFPNLSEILAAEGPAPSTEQALRAFQLTGTDSVRLQGLREPGLVAELLWMARTAGTLFRALNLSLLSDPKESVERERGRRADQWTSILFSPQETFLIVASWLEDQTIAPPIDTRGLIFTITPNRPASTAVATSRQTVKADACGRVFDIRCDGITWGIVDTGVDATHPAFRLRGTDGKLLEPAFALKKDRFGREYVVNNTRIRATFDFTEIRQLLLYNPIGEARLPAETEKRLNAAGIIGASLDEMRKSLRRALQSGRELDWGQLRPFVEVPHRINLDANGTPQGPYRIPTTAQGHGTHVAGILGANWEQGAAGSTPPFAPPPTVPPPNTAGAISVATATGGSVGLMPSQGIALSEDCPCFQGICPDIVLYDLRALRGDRDDDEFAVISALQFVRHLNSHRDQMEIHGVNISLSLRHDVRNYACGRTPVCDECERLVGSGVVVVAAAGNAGWQDAATMGAGTEGYRTLSITDPGNAASVITVGATHRSQPFTYGVSYFSSRGPTGDGRNKPDLVAPGEKIEAPYPNNDLCRLDGTSMAAPHVSGAAALLMARNREMIGQPNRIKKILCDTATDLGRERYFQGAGLLDILRALQSV